MCEVFGLAERELLSMSYNLLMGERSGEEPRNSNMAPIFNSVIKACILLNQMQSKYRHAKITVCYRMMRVLKERF